MRKETLIIICLVVVLSITGFLYYRVISIGRMVNFQTYTNQEYGFEISYPENYEVSPDSLNKNVFYIHKSGAESEPEIFITVAEDKYTLAFQGTFVAIPYSELTNLTELVSSEEVTINEVLFNKDSWSIRPGLVATSFNVKNGDKYYSIFWGNSKKDDVRNRIIATFKFIK